MPAGGRLIPSSVPVAVKPTGWSEGSSNRGGVGRRADAGDPRPLRTGRGAKAGELRAVR